MHHFESLAIDYDIGGDCKLLTGRHIEAGKSLSAKYNDCYWAIHQVMGIIIVHGHRNQVVIGKLGGTIEVKGNGNRVIVIDCGRFAKINDDGSGNTITINQTPGALTTGINDEQTDEGNNTTAWIQRHAALDEIQHDSPRGMRSSTLTTGRSTLIKALGGDQNTPITQATDNPTLGRSLLRRPLAYPLSDSMVSRQNRNRPTTNLNLPFRITMARPVLINVRQPNPKPDQSSDSDLDDEPVSVQDHALPPLASNQLSQLSENSSRVIEDSPVHESQSIEYTESSNRIVDDDVSFDYVDNSMEEANSEAYDRRGPAQLPEGEDQLEPVMVLSGYQDLDISHNNIYDEVMPSWRRPRLEFHPRNYLRALSVSGRGDEDLLNFERSNSIDDGIDESREISDDIDDTEDEGPVSEHEDSMSENLSIRPPNDHMDDIPQRILVESVLT